MDQPAVGLGTLGLKESAEAAIGKATELECALIDTGEHYGNLELVGQALEKAAKRPFVIVKLSGMPIGEYDVIKERMSAMLRQLGIDQADLCLMHWPGACTWDPADMTPLTSPGDFEGKASSWEEFCAMIGPAWSNMLQLKIDGLCKEIGTSNFYAHHLEELTRACSGATPFANEIFIDVTNPETEFVEAMRKQGTRILAYRPIAYKPHPDQVKAIAERIGSGTSPQSVILAWLLRRGIFPLVKCRGDHVAENLTVPASLKDKITDADLEALRTCEVDMRFSAEWFAKIWKAHNKAAAFSEEDVQMLTGMGVDEAKARAVLEKSGGNMELAMDMAFAE